jgi:sialic acid synthase SpsE
MAGIAKSTGADVILKLQFRDLDSFLHPADRIKSALGPLSKHTKRFVETRLDETQFRELVDYSRSKGLPVYATPFDETSVDRCVEFGFDLVKVASCSAYDWPLLRKIASTGLPVICSLGGLTVNEADDVVDYFTREVG